MARIIFYEITMSPQPANEIRSCTSLGLKKQKQKEHTLGMSTRACHLELVDDLLTDHFIMALKRFIAPRGWPQSIHSDNLSVQITSCGNALNYWRRKDTNFCASLGNWVEMLATKCPALWRSVGETSKVHKEDAEGNSGRQDSFPKKCREPCKLKQKGYLTMNPLLTCPMMQGTLKH